MNLNDCKLIKVGAKIDMSEVSLVEENLDVSFPQDFIAFILTTNGGVPEGDIVFEFKDLNGDNDSSVVNRFYSIFPENLNDRNNAVKLYLSMRKEKRLPHKAFPIGEDPSGNLMCILLDTINYGHIYFWDHEIEFQDESYKGMSFIADSFSKFIDLCYLD
ncbi:MAG: SMI1/KNR4 family protein [Oscillospiraceae bacterium]|nr:SMI1/KNR4 family protein [Oscillospiraceae bacterium]